MFGERFRIIERLGGGGMGEVYRARDLRVEQDVALKVLREEVGRDSTAMEMLAKEVRAARQIAHPGVCRVFDLGQFSAPTGSRPYLSMELVDGETLDRFLRRIGVLPEAKGLQIAHELCSAMEAIHQRGVLHRDLKPANVMIDGRGHARITDFGLALDRGGLSQRVLPAGTPGFVAPEILDGREPTVASDLYALGLVLYEVFTGVAAYPPGSVSGMLSAQSRDDPPRPASIKPTINPRIERAILACLDRRPDRRPSSALEVSAMLPGGDPLKSAVAAGLTPSPDTVAAAARRGVLPAATALGVLALVAVSIGIVIWLGSTMSLSALAPDLKPPSVLIERARNVLEAVGAPGRAAGSFGFFDLDETLVGDAEKDPAGVDRREMIDFIYRQGSINFSTRDMRGGVLFDDPPEGTPGVSTVRLSRVGRLQELRVCPDGKSDAAGTGTPLPGVVEATRGAKGTDPFSSLFEFAGLKLDEATSTPPEARPPMYAERVLAWNVRDAERQDRSLRVDGALLDGKPVWFLVSEQGRTPWRAMLPLEIPQGFNAGDVIATVVQLGSVAIGLGLGLWNIRRKRSDLRGATRLAVLMGVIATSHGILSLNASPRDGLAVAIVLSVAVGLFNAAISFVLYAALEPFARRMWPETLISWARLIQGRWSDPLVGRDVLLGACTGLGCAALFCLAVFVPHWISGAPIREPKTDDFELRAFSGVLPLISNQMTNLNAAIIATTATLIALILLKFLLRRRDAAMLVLSIIQGSTWGLAGEVHGIGWIFVLAMGVLMVTTLTNVGLLATITAVAVGYAVMSSSLTTDMQAWYVPWMMVPIAMACVLALGGAVIAIRGEPGPAEGQA